MESDRRGFLNTALGASAVSVLVEPQTVESLKRGGIYALTFDRDLTRSERDALKESCEAFRQRTGCELLILGKGVSVVKLEGSNGE